MLWAIMIVGTVMYVYTLNKMDALLGKCIIYCDNTLRDEYRTLEFYNKIFFIMGFPIIITGILVLKIIIWFYKKDSCY